MGLGRSRGLSASVFSQVFGAIRWDVVQENPKFEEQHGRLLRPFTPPGAFDLDSRSVHQQHNSCLSTANRMIGNRSALLRGTVSHGLELTNG